MIPVLCMWDDNEKQIRGNALKKQVARVTSCYQQRSLFFIGQYCSFIAFYLDVKVFRVKDNSTPETHLKKYLTLLLSLLNTKGRKSGFRPHGAIIHWSGIFEPPERNLCVLGRITQDNVFKSKVQQSSGNKYQFLEHYSTVETIQSQQK